ncbi:MAG: hypothetical protein ACE5GN_01510 [Waddliaceae bacterium]
MGIKAKESRQVQKARKKLEKQLEAEHKLVNKKALDQMKKAIQIWIKRHKEDRIALLERPIELFDENRHSVQTKSKFVSHLIEKLRKEANKTLSFKRLIGRIKK